MEIFFTLDEIDETAGKLLALFGQIKVIAVNGEMGAGKTTLIQALCRRMGVTDKMSSPTYSIIQQYTTTAGLIIHHMDIYRVKDIHEAVQAGVEEAIYSGDLCFIEWPEKIMNILPLHFMDICIEPVNHTKRRLVINITGESRV